VNPDEAAPLIARGARIDVWAAANLGRMAELVAVFTPACFAMSDRSVATFVSSCSASRLICKSRSARLSAQPPYDFE
jgi:hypothetical protein